MGDVYSDNLIEVHVRFYLYFWQNKPVTSLDHTESHVVKRKAACRVGDVYPDNMVEVHVRAYLYRWQNKDEHEVHGMNYQVCPPPQPHKPCLAPRLAWEAAIKAAELAGQAGHFQEPGATSPTHASCTHDYIVPACYFPQDPSFDLTADRL